MNMVFTCPSEGRVHSPTQSDNTTESKEEDEEECLLEYIRAQRGRGSAQLDT